MDSNDRLVSLDAFRGMTIAAMILVNNPGDWGHIYWPLAHAAWHGWTPTDLIFPFFLFMVGMAIPFSRRARAGEVVRRALVIAGLGLFMAAYPQFDLATMRIPGVLMRIALCYLAAWVVSRVVTGAAGQAAVAAFLLVLYWWLMTRVPVPGGIAPNLEAETNLGAWLDRTLLDGHLWKWSRTWDPEGLLSTLPAIATTLIGLLAGRWVRSDRDGNGKTAGLVAGGLVLVALGLAWSVTFPLNKSLWTSSYALFTAGMAAYLFALVFWIADVRGRRSWTRPFVVYGRNAILVFVGSGLLAETLGVVQVGPPDARMPLQERLYLATFGGRLDPYAASLAWALANVVFWFLILRELDRRRIYLKA